MQKAGTLDKISLEGVRCEAIVGVLPEERVRRRPIIIDIHCFTDVARASHTDDIVHTIDYAKVQDAVFRIVRNTSFHLIETLAEAIASSVLDFPGVLFVNVKLTKPKAIPDCDAVSVEIRRKR